MAKVHPLPEGAATAATSDNSEALTQEQRASILQDVKDRLGKMVDYLNELSDAELLAAADDLVKWEEIASKELERRKSQSEQSAASTGTDVPSVPEGSSTKDPAGDAIVPDGTVVSGESVQPAPMSGGASADPPADQAGSTAATDGSPRTPSEQDPLFSSGDESSPNRLEFNSLLARVVTIEIFIKKHRPDFAISE